MKCDDGAVAGVSHYIGKHLWSAKFLTVVTGYQIPHYYLITAFQYHVLRPSHVAVRRAEQVCFHYLVGFLGICQIIFEVVFKSSEMVKGMVTDAVSPLHNHLEFIRVLTDICPL